jgi:hypothetical protein
MLTQPFFFQGNLWQFSPQFGFIPLGMDPAFGSAFFGPQGFMGTPGFGGFPGFISPGFAGAFPGGVAPGFATGFPTAPFVGGGAPVVIGPMVDGFIPFTPEMAMQPAIPTLGVTGAVVPPLPRTFWGAPHSPGPQIAMEVFTGVPDDPTMPVQERVAGVREELTPERPDAQEIQVAQRVERIMEERPLREGQVIAVNERDIEVRYELNGEAVTERLPMDEVFFFDENERLRSAESFPDLVARGDSVLFATPVERVAGVQEVIPQEAVAGERQEIRIEEDDLLPEERVVAPARRPAR